jgi:dipeptidyl aminopeptidase/acylaminoacyl peptidase
MNPIAAARCIADVSVGEPRLSPGGDVLGFVRARAGDSAELVFVRLGDGGEATLRTDPAPCAPRGMGGGCWCWIDDDTVAVAGVDGNMWLAAADGSRTTRLTDVAEGSRASSPDASPDGRWLVVTIDDAEVMAIDLAEGRAQRIDDGQADFVADPTCMPCGAGAVWQAWNVPDMPWDGARVEMAAFDGSARESEQPSGAAQQPRFMPDGRGVCVRDDSGWLNVWAGDSPLVDEPFEHAGPSWGPGQRSFAVSPDGAQVAFTRNERGFGRLCVVDVATGAVHEVARCVHGQLSWRGERLAGLRSGAVTPTQIVAYDTATWTRTHTIRADERKWLPDELAEPEAHTFTARDSATLHARVYPAADPDGRLICWLHGGPTDQWPVTFMPRLAYWRSRGWSIIVPDFRGSTGHGRSYQQALRGRWGELDVSDTVDVLTAAHRQGLGHADRTVLFGSSAGGFTALHVIAARPDLAQAAALAYPVSDLADLEVRSHRFERHYQHSLIGAPHQRYTAALLRERSPLSWPEQLTRRPLLLLHGDADPVVPVDHSRRLAAAVLAAGGSVTLHEYPEEGHGFRRPEHQLDEYARTERFLAQHVPRA